MLSSFLIFAGVTMYRRFLFPFLLKYFSLLEVILILFCFLRWVSLLSVTMWLVFIKSLDFVLNAPLLVGMNYCVISLYLTFVPWHILCWYHFYLHVKRYRLTVHLFVCFHSKTKQLSSQTVSSGLYKCRNWAELCWRSFLNL